MTTFVHKLDSAGTSCVLCGAVIPFGHHALPGEYVALITYDVSIPFRAYRTGSANRDPLCDGTPATEFHQESFAADLKQAEVLAKAP